MKAVKENKVYRIETESQKKRYLNEGFDIYDEEELDILLEKIDDKIQSEEHKKRTELSEARLLFEY